MHGRHKPLAAAGPTVSSSQALTLILHNTGAVWSVHAGRCPGGGVFAAYGCEDGLVCTLEAAVPRDTRLQQPAPVATCGGDPQPVDAAWHGHQWAGNAHMCVLKDVEQRRLVQNPPPAASHCMLQSCKR